MSIKLQCPCKCWFVYQDKACPKCGKRVTTFTDKKYRLDYYDNEGIRHRRNIGSSLTVAKELWTKEKERLSQEKLTPHVHNNLKLSQVLDWYKELPEVKKLRSYKNKMGALNSTIKEFGDSYISDITKGMILSYKNKLRQDKEDGTVQHILSSLRAMINTAIEYEIIPPTSAFYRLKFKLSPKERDRHINYDEFMAIYHSCPNQIWRDWVTLGYYTGMRQMEIVQLEWHEVDLENQVIRLSSSRTKTKEPRVVPINLPELMEIFDRYPKVGIWVFSRDIMRQSKPEFNWHTWKAIRDRAGVEDLHFHDLRHVALNNMRMNGIDGRVIMKIAGHKTTRMYLKYTKALDEEVKSVFKFSTPISTQEVLEDRKVLKINRKK